MTKVSEKIKRLRIRCLNDLYFLVTQILYAHDAHKYDPDFHKWICDNVSIGTKFTNEDGAQPQCRELWLLPRSHFKTTILTIGHCIQQILRNPGGSYIMLSGKDEHALLMSDETRRHFVFNDRLRALFPRWCAESEDAMGSKGEWTTPAKWYFGKKRREPTVTATGFKSRLESKHYNGGYLDDCMGEDDTSETGLLEVRENYKKVIPLVDSDGFIIMPGTRKHYNDLYQAAMDTGVYKVFVRHGLESKDKICDMDECSRYALPHKAVDFKAGVPLSEKRVNREGYTNLLRECEIDVKLGQSYFWHEYMNIPFSPTDRKYQPAWFQKIPDEMIPGKHTPFYPLTKWIAIDSALKDEEHPSGYDFNVVVVGGFDEFGRLYILDIFRDRDWTEKQLGDCVITCMKTSEYGGISRVIVEKVGEVRLNNFLRDRARQAGVPIQVISITRGGRGAKSKYERIVGCQGYFEQGRVFFRKSCENFEDTVNEFCNLGRWTNDDLADAISMFFDEQAKVMPPPNVQDTKPAGSFHPMPFDGGWSRAAYVSSQPRPAVKEPPPGWNASYGDGVRVYESQNDGIPLATAGEWALNPKPTNKQETPRAFKPFR